MFVWVLLGVFYMMGATLTLPGIAAFVLGIGIAVDSNIITAERIKDELRNGKTIASSLKRGSEEQLPDDHRRAYYDDYRRRRALFHGSRHREELRDRPYREYRRQYRDERIFAAFLASLLDQER